MGIETYQRSAARDAELTAPGHKLSASDPLADGLVDLEAALRAKDLGGGYVIFEDLVRTAETLCRAPAEETRALHDRARAMRIWRLLHRAAAAPAPILASEVRQDLRETALHCLIVEGRVGRADFYRFGFAHADIVAHGAQALAEARRDYAVQRAQTQGTAKARKGAAA